MSAEPAALVGLSPAEVAQRVADGKVNHLPPHSGRTTKQIVRANVFTRVNGILLVLFCLVMVTGYWMQGAFGLLIVANSVIGIIQELRAKRTLDSLAVVGEAHPIVIRSGVRERIRRDEVVLDDLVAVGPGDQIVVDGVIVAEDYLEVDESMLTGESDPVEKALGDDVFSGAYVVAGSGVYRTQRVGADAYAAQLTAQASKFTLVNSELRQGVNKILGIVGWLLVPVGLLVAVAQFRLPDTTWQESILRATGALVPMVPEGLVLLTSMAFALGVIRLGRRNCLVQELPAIEGLARVSVVCADKTGTLTSNEMTVSRLVPLALDADQIRTVLEQLVAADPAPNASMQAIASHLPKAEEHEEPWEVTARAPFTSAKKWSGATFREHGSWVLGAPDVLAAGEIAAQAEEIASQGLRVLLLGQVPRDVDDQAGPGPVTPGGLIVLDQLRRPDAAQTIEYFKEEHVEVKVISGDNAASVGAVARSLGLDAETVVDARSLPMLADDEFIERVNTADVFGRVTPEQKRQMVGALKKGGHHVAMTGDGVNDVLALKDADLGVAMGSGSAATRGVAQIVLLDDRFATLPHVVAEGRRVIGNIERVAKLFLTKTIYSVTIALVVGILQIASPFLPLQVTVVGWFTIGIPAFLMSLAPNRERAQPGFVTRTLRVAVPGGITVAAAALTTYLMTGGNNESDPTLQVQAATAALLALVMTSTWVLSIVARPYVWWRLALVATSYAFYFLIFTLPVARRLLSLDVSNWPVMMVGIVAGLIGMGVLEATWWVTAALRRERPRLWARPDAELD